MILSRKIIHTFAKWSKPKPKPKTIEARSFAVGDQKAAKLSKSQQQQQNKLKALQADKIQKQTKRKIQIVKQHSVSLQQFKSTQQLEEIQYYQKLYLLGKKSQKPAAIAEKEQQQQDLQFQYLPLESDQIDPQTGKRHKKPIKYGNYVRQINQRLAPIQQFKGDQTLRRNGTLGVKLGMTTLFDQWGDAVPVTIVLLDRVQIVQIKPPQPGNTFYQVQMGLGDKRIKRVTKALMGHYLKANVPPKQKLAQFRVSKQCLLPIGYMMSVRHYTPGMFVDVAGKTVGHGFQGTIKKYGFARQPATHGNSLTTRVLGSTGGRQDPGRVFKQKKMYGQMGQKISVQQAMTIFRIDVDKNILYIKGSLPGKAGTILKIWDSLIPEKAENNLNFTHFPTFVEKQGEKYARVFSMYCGQRDPDELQVHDNAYILDDGQQSSADKEEVPKDKDLVQE